MTGAVSAVITMGDNLASFIYHSPSGRTRTHAGADTTLRWHTVTIVSYMRVCGLLTECFCTTTSYFNAHNFKITLHKNFSRSGSSSYWEM